MNALDKLFPGIPKYKALWWPIYLEPIIGSGERITIAIAIISNDGSSKVIQAIRNELLECLYGAKADHFQSLILWICESLDKNLSCGRKIQEWTPPFQGIFIGECQQAADDDIKGILRQAIRFSASLSCIALEAERSEDEQEPKKYADRWIRSIQDEVKAIDAAYLSAFSKKVQLKHADILTTYGFINEKYASNFGLLIPMRLSASLNSIKAKILDLEGLKKANLTMKPEKYELIIGIPSLDNPTLSENITKKIEQNLKFISEVAESEDIHIFAADNAKKAANHLLEQAA